MDVVLITLSLAGALTQVPIRGCFGDLRAVLDGAGFPVGSVDAVLMDIGASSMQLGNAERGFSFNHTGGTTCMRRASFICTQHIFCLHMYVLYVVNNKLR